VEFGLFVEPQVGGTYERLVLAAFARSDHYLNMAESAHTTDALVSLGAVAVETAAIRLVTMVSPLTFRHPAVMAKSATTIDEISHGRFSLGVGTGWMETEHEAFGLTLPDLKERFDRLGEALAYIRTVFDGGGATSGDHYRLAAPSVRPAASPGLQIVVGGGGPKKTPTLAGRYADEYNLFVTDAATLRDRISVMREAAMDAGRDPDGILVSLAGPGLVYRDPDEHRAVIASRAHARDMSPDAYEAMLDERLVPHGTPSRAKDAVASMADLGVGRYYVQEYRALDAVDTDRLEFVFEGLAP
jgi:alkanesulfonate monooxygenase SsuD/methylene tetrahydromethanopterin reductase-like flavin-dependent oxidoreductase (luciferase family)